MSSTYTSNLKLNKPANNDPGWDTPIRADLDAIDAQNAIGDLAVSIHETPSTTLNVDVAAGIYLKTDGTVGTYAGTTSVLLTASLTNYIYLDSTGSLVHNTTGWPGSGAYYPLATVLAGSTSITSTTDARVCFTAVGAAGLTAAGGTLNDGANLAVGTSTGTKIGTSSSQKLGFFGAAPVVRPTMGSATAGSSYTATEQSMLQAVYNAVRNLGLGS